MANTRPFHTCLYNSLIILLISVLFCISPAFAQESKKEDAFAKLKQKLVKDGFQKEKIDALFDKKEVFFDPSGVSLLFTVSESSLDYGQFASKKSIKKASLYMEKHQETLDKAQKIYGVDKTVITAIILVETRLGKYLGKHTVLNTLATIATLSDDAARQRIWQSIPDKKKPKKEKFTKKAKSRSKWGYEELKAFLKYAKREGIDPEKIAGSYAGAIGISQFMPSNALTLAKDGNNDGNINLFSHEDAIFSIANFLMHHGWKPGLARQKKHKVLFRYNHSNYYVDTLLKVSDKLKG